MVWSHVAYSLRSEKPGEPKWGGLMKHKLLLIDDCSLDLEVLQELLEKAGYSVKATLDPEVGIAFVRQNRGAVSLAMLDFGMPGKNGGQVAEILKKLDPQIQIATYSGLQSSDVLDTLEVGSQYFIQKGTKPEQILAIVKMLCRRYEELHKTIVVEPVTEADIEKANALGLIGRSHNLAEVSQLVHIYSPHDEIILVTGENGTGKERVARAIHNVSGRRGPFIAVNCGAIPHDLLESELFGHEKGSFSGAMRDKIGLVKAADKGTLFLDEIGDLPAPLQVKILRFLQEGEIRPVGSNETILVNTRVIAATNVDLESAVLTGKFRQDLYHRLKGFIINLKPLRERREDIKPLVLKFSEAFSKDKGVNKEFLEETVKLLARFDWPGNVRELEHEVKRAMMLAPENKVKPSDIHPLIRTAIEKYETNDLIGLDLDYESFRGKQKLRDEDEEKQFLLEKSKNAKSVRELARDILNISNSTLQGRLKSLGIEFKPKASNQQTKGELEYETT